jgi:uridine phosphorylase
MNDSLIKFPERRTPPKLLVIVPLGSMVKSYRNYFETATKSTLTEVRSSLPGSRRFTYKTIEIIGPIVGSPAAVLAVEPFLAAGCRNVLLLGASGGLKLANKALDLGNFVFPDNAISEEGTSKLYGATSELIPAEKHSLQISFEKQFSEYFKKNNLPSPIFHHGAMWTTDAPYRETVEKVMHYSLQGAISVDMEYSALLQLCSYYKASLTSAFVITDTLTDEWIPGFSSPQVKSSSKILTQFSTIWALQVGDSPL